MDAPSTEELDAVALYVITARELHECRFFVEEHYQLSISSREGDPPEALKAEFPDPDTVSAVLIPFRKLWMESEPCFHRRVAKIIKRFCEQLRGRVDHSFSLSAGEVPMIPFPRGVDLSKEDVIDLWLNTRYMHVGTSGRKGRFTREDFHRWETQVGAALFEYYFLTSVVYVGVLFFNILRDAEEFLKWCKAKGWTSGIDTVAPGANPNVVRNTPGFEQGGDSQERMAWRLRRRRKYKGFAVFLEHKNLSDADVARFVCECETFPGFCNKIGVRLEQRDARDDPDWKDIVFSSGALDEHLNVVRLGRVRKGMFFVTRSGDLKWNEDWLELVSEQYLAFREALPGD